MILLCKVTKLQTPPETAGFFHARSWRRRRRKALGPSAISLAAAGRITGRHDRSGLPTQLHAHNPSIIPARRLGGIQAADDSPSLIATRSEPAPAPVFNGYRGLMVTARVNFNEALQGAAMILSLTFHAGAFTRV